VKWLASSGVTVLTGGKYNPRNVVNRGAMAQFMWKLIGKPAFGNQTAAAKKVAKDAAVQKLKKSKKSSDQERYKCILWLIQNNITVISNNGKYNPGNPVNRGAMAQFLRKLYVVDQTGKAYVG
jgi:hypothetical protein